MHEYQITVTNAERMRLLRYVRADIKQVTESSSTISKLAKLYSLEKKLYRDVAAKEDKG